MNAVMMGFSSYTDEMGKATPVDTILAHHGLLLRPSGKSYTLYTSYTNAGVIGFSYDTGATLVGGEWMGCTARCCIIEFTPR